MAELKYETTQIHWQPLNLNHSMQKQQEEKIEPISNPLPSEWVTFRELDTRDITHADSANMSMCHFVRIGNWNFILAPNRSRSIDTMFCVYRGIIFEASIAFRMFLPFSVKWIWKKELVCCFESANLHLIPIAAIAHDGTPVDIISVIAQLSVESILALQLSYKFWHEKKKFEKRMQKTKTNRKTNCCAISIQYLIKLLLYSAKLTSFAFKSYYFFVLLLFFFSHNFLRMPLSLRATKHPLSAKTLSEPESTKTGGRKTNQVPSWMLFVCPAT